MNVPKPGDKILVKSMGTDAKLLDKPVKSVSLLGSSVKLEWKQLPEGLAVVSPADIRLEYAAVFRITQ